MASGSRDTPARQTVSKRAVEDRLFRAEQGMPTPSRSFVLDETAFERSNRIQWYTLGAGLSPVPGRCGV
jgi:hypothetical protein